MNIQFNYIVYYDMCVCISVSDPGHHGEGRFEATGWDAADP